jgi:hypothetical protein
MDMNVLASAPPGSRSSLYGPGDLVMIFSTPGREADAEYSSSSEEETPAPVADRTKSNRFSTLNIFARRQSANRNSKSLQPSASADSVLASPAKRKSSIFGMSPVLAQTQSQPYVRAPSSEVDVDSVCVF